MAPWFSLPAYFLYVLTVIGITYLIYRHYAEKKKLEILLYQENIEKDQKEQIHQAQLRFFTNISHDFRTPLSLILAALDKLRREGLKEYYYRILNGNVQRLLNLVNELMDFRTVENGMMKLELQRKFGGSVQAEEIGLPVRGKDGLILPCGASGRWSENI